MATSPTQRYRDTLRRVLLFRQSSRAWHMTARVHVRLRVLARFPVARVLA